MDSANAHASLDDVLVALSNAQRRKLLDSLNADSPPTDAENSGTTLDYDIAMHHIHLPILADRRLINWNRETNRVTKGPNFEMAEAILEFLEDSDEVSLPVKIEV